MNKKIKVFFVSVIITLMGFINLSHAQTANQNSPLSAKQQSIVAISALTANGDLDQLKTALSDGLTAGLTVNEVKEILIHMYAYTGFPRSLNGINTFMALIEERQKQGINDVIGEEPKPVGTDKSKYDIGKENLAVLTGIQPPVRQTGYAAFVPTIEVFLKEHLFADIFERGVLDYQTRELVTVSALASLGNADAQLRSHLNVAMHNGLTEPQLRSMVAIVGEKVGKVQGENAGKVLDQVVNNRKG